MSRVQHILSDYPTCQQRQKQGVLRGARPTKWMDVACRRTEHEGCHDTQQDEGWGKALRHDGRPAARMYSACAHVANDVKPEYAFARASTPARDSYVAVSDDGEHNLDVAPMQPEVHVGAFNGMRIPDGMTAVILSETAARKDTHQQVPSGKLSALPQFAVNRVELGPGPAGEGLQQARSRSIRSDSDPSTLAGDREFPYDAADGVSAPVATPQWQGQAVGIAAVPGLDICLPDSRQRYPTQVHVPLQGPCMGVSTSAKSSDSTAFVSSRKHVCAQMMSNGLPTGALAIGGEYNHVAPHCEESAGGSPLPVGSITAGTGSNGSLLDGVRSAHGANLEQDSRFEGCSRQVMRCIVRFGGLQDWVGPTAHPKLAATLLHPHLEFLKKWHHLRNHYRHHHRYHHWRYHLQ